MSNTSNSKRELKKDNSISIGGGLFTPTTGNTLGGTGSGLTNKFNRNFGVDYNSKGSSNFKGEAKSNIAESFETALSVIIEETYQNGNYYVKGSKQLLIDGQMQEIIISGVIRPYDITPDNSILSTQIANLKIMYKKDGEEADTTKVPFIFKLLLKALML